MVLQATMWWGGNRFTYREQVQRGDSYSYGINLGDGGGPSNGSGSSWVEYLFAAPNLTWETESKFNAGGSISGSSVGV